TGFHYASADGEACVTLTLVPAGPVAVAVCAWSCFAKSWTRRRPRLGMQTGGRISMSPTPLSDTVSFQSGPAILYDTTIDAPIFSSGKACFNAFITNSVTIIPILTTSRESTVRLSAWTVKEIGRFSPTIDWVSVSQRSER